MTNRQLLSFAKTLESEKITFAFEGPWSGHFVSRHADCAQKAERSKRKLI